MNNGQQTGQDVVQWLAQIKELKQQLADSQKERDQAYETAANWQRLYETEAQQRRTDLHLAQAKIEELQAQVQELQGTTAPKLLGSATPEAFAQELEKLDPTQVKQKLIAVLTERDRASQEVVRLAQALKEEQDNHVQTRKSLTVALGDAIDQLTKHREKATQKNAEE